MHLSPCSNKRTPKSNKNTINKKGDTYKGGQEGEETNTVSLLHIELCISSFNLPNIPVKELLLCLFRR